MKVGILIKSLGRGGAESLLLEHLAEAEAQSSDSIYEVGYCRPEVDELLGPLTDLADPTLVASSEIGLPFSRDFWRWVNRQDLIHVQSPLVGSVVRVLSAIGLLRAPLVYTEHGMWNQYHPLTRAANRLTYRWSDASFAVSGRVKSSMSQSAARATEVLYHGIEPISPPLCRDALRTSLGISRRETAFLTVANFRPEKRLERLVQLAAELSGYDCSFTLIGAGPLEEQIAAANREAGSPLRLLGRRSDVRALIGAFDAFVLTSDFEGLPVAVMEAVSAGLPIVSTDCGGVSELIEDEVNGLISPVGDSDGLRDACRRVMKTPVHRRLAEGVEAMKERVSRAAFVRRLETEYSALERLGM